MTTTNDNNKPLSQIIGWLQKTIRSFKEKQNKN